jgi:hypothetical protein
MSAIDNSKIPILKGIETLASWKTCLINTLMTQGISHVLTESPPERPQDPKLFRESDKEDKGSKKGTEVKNETYESEVKLFIYKEKKYDEWKHDNQRALGLIRLTVAKNIQSIASMHSTAKEAFTAITKSFERSESEYRAAVTKELTNATMGFSEDPIEYVDRFERILEKAEGLEIKLSINDKATYFFNSLPPKYDNLLSRWDVEKGFSDERGLTITFSNLRRLFELEALRKKTVNENETSVAMFTRKNNCPQNRRNKNSNVICWNCGKKNHTSNECRSPKVGDGMRFRNTGKVKNKNGINNLSVTSSPGPTSYEVDSLFAEGNGFAGTAIQETTEGVALFSQTTNVPGEIRFLIDSGATDHICNSREEFATIKDMKQAKSFSMIKGSVDVTECGSIKAISECGKAILLEDVHYIPSTPHNILSSGTLIKKGWEVDLMKGKLSKGNLEIKFKRVGPLKKLNEVVLRLPGIKTNRSKHSTSIPWSLYTVQESDSLEGWHKRLGHIGLTKIKDLEKDKKIIIEDDDNSFKREDCEICMKAKATRLTFGDISIAAKEPLEIVHSDLAGPLRPSQFETSYYITFIDDYTGLVSASHLKSKNSSEILSVFKREISYWERAFEKKVKIIRTDGGTEYKGVFDEYLVKQGIVHQVTTPYTPQLNGTAERYNRTIKEMVGAMLIDAKLDMKVWPFALRYAVNLLNMSKSFKEETLDEKVYKRKSNWGKIQAFGAKCWVRIPTETCGKGDLTQPKAVEGRLLSLQPAASGYTVMINQEPFKWVSSRDVIFARPRTPIKPSLTSSIQTSLIPGTQTVSIPAVTTSESATTIDNASTPEVTKEVEKELSSSVDVQPSQETLTASSTQAEPRRSPRIQGIEPFIQPNDYVHLALTALENEYDPMSYDQAINSKNAHEWKNAMKRELISIKETGTWKEVTAPEGVNLVGSKWVYKTKVDANDQIVKYKARIVAQGYTQVEGVDFYDTYSPVARMTSLRLFLTIVASEDLELIQMDADTAFLNGKLDEEIYMNFPPGYEKEKGSTTALKLVRSLYGLKQSPHVWWRLVSNYLKELEFDRLDSDWGIYLNKKSSCYLLLYVDDVLIAAPKASTIQEIQTKLMNKWKWTVVNDASYILGIKLKRNRDKRTISLSQTGYIEKVLKRYNLQEIRTVTTPLNNCLLIKNTEKIDNGRRTYYQGLTGSIMWAATAIRPDLAFTAGYLARFNMNPSEEHLKAAKRTIAYMKGTKDTELVLGGNNIGQLIGYVDSDYAGDVDTRRSTTGYAFLWRESLISWGSTRQATVATSTCEAEYMSLSEAAKEGIWLESFIGELGENKKGFTLLCDNQGAIALAENPSRHRRTKHIDIRYHFIRELIEDNSVDISYISTSEQLADFLTKPLSRQKHEANCKKLGVMGI